MRRISGAIVCLFVFIFLAGCGGPAYPELPEDATAFETGSFTDTADDGAYYSTIVFEGRTYMPYGTQGKTVRKSCIDRCVGYIVQDGEEQTDDRIYTLTDDPEHNYLMSYYIGTTLMNPPTFFRAVDTRGMDIDTPEYIDGLGYGFWSAAQPDG